MASKAAILARMVISSPAPPEMYSRAMAGSFLRARGSKSVSEEMVPGMRLEATEGMVAHGRTVSSFEFRVSSKYKGEPRRTRRVLRGQRDAPRARSVASFAATALLHRQLQINFLEFPIILRSWNSRDYTADSHAINAG